jgi:hypothetical protein
LWRLAAATATPAQTLFADADKMTVPTSQAAQADLMCGAIVMVVREVASMGIGTKVNIFLSKFLLRRVLFCAWIAPVFWVVGCRPDFVFSAAGVIRFCRLVSQQADGSLPPGSETEDCNSLAGKKALFRAMSPERPQFQRQAFPIRGAPGLSACRRSGAGSLSARKL